MRVEKEKIILHADMNNCYASIECILHPELERAPFNRLWQERIPPWDRPS